MRDFAETVDDLDLIDGMDGGRETAVDAENLIVDHDGEGEEIEHVRKVVPDVRVAVLARAFGVEPVRLCYATGFVVATDQMYAGGVAQLEADEEGDGFHTEETTVDIVT